jgi:hypothetical protein
MTFSRFILAEARNGDCRIYKRGAREYFLRWQRDALCLHCDSDYISVCIPIHILICKQTTFKMSTLQTLTHYLNKVD